MPTKFKFELNDKVTDFDIEASAIIIARSEYRDLDVENNYLLQYDNHAYRGAWVPESSLELI